MPDADLHSELLRTLGRLVRGLSALFWGLPLALILSVGTAGGGWFKTWISGCGAPLVGMGLLLFGLIEIGSFQKQERPWRTALDRARLLALINVGLSPFLYLWHRMPEHPFFISAVVLLIVSALVFLFNLNHVLKRLGAMLPDEGLRFEIRQYTTLNQYLLVILVVMAAANLVIVRSTPFNLWAIPELTEQLNVLSVGFRFTLPWLALVSVCVLILLPLAMTMALIWKTKQVIFDSVFGAQR